MRGLNTEVDPRKLSRLKEPAFPQFLNLTTSGEYVHPVWGDGTHATQTFAEQQLGTSAVSPSFSMEGTAGYQAYCALAGGSVALRDSGGTALPLAYTTPVEAPTLWEFPILDQARNAGVGWWTSAIVASEWGVGYGSSATYSAAWSDGLAYHSGLAPVATLVNDLQHVQLDMGTADQPTFPTGSGMAIAGTGASGTYTGTFTGYYRSPAGYYEFGIREGTLTGTMASGETLSWAGSGGTGTGTLQTAVATVATATYAAAYLIHPATLPSEGTPDNYTGYALGESGSYYWMGQGTIPISGARGNAVLAKAPANYGTVYDGPLDTNGLPENLIVPGTCQALTIHKGCLFLGEGQLLRWSEGALTGKEYRWFREGFTIDAGGTIWALISRGEILEVWTSSGVRYAQGNSPYFEIREYQVHEPCIARYSIHATDHGTYYLASDGVRVLSGATSTLLSEGWVSPWFDDIADPTACVGGGSEDRYYLVDATGRCLIWQQSAKEWSERTFSAQPEGFLWSTVGRYPVAKVGANYVSVAAGTGAVSWQAQYPTRSESKNRPLPSFFYLNNVGTVYVDVYVDDAKVKTIQLIGNKRGRVRLPATRGVDWYLVLRGSGTPETSKIWGLE